MPRIPKPVVVVSACLEFEKVRYDGQVIPCPLVRELEPYAEYIKVCPEVAIGLGVPRDPIRIVKIGGAKRLIQPKTKEDITERMNAFTTGFIDALPEVDGFIFKSKSPTIGLRGIKVYADLEAAPVIERSSGFFADQIIAAFPGYPMEDDDRLRNATIRHEFLTKLFTFAAFRQVKQEHSFEALRAFHETNLFLFRSYNAELTAELEDTVQHAAVGRGRDSLFGSYSTALTKLLAGHSRAESKLHAVQQIFSRFAPHLTSAERAFFADVITDYEQNRVCFLCVLDVLKAYALRFEDEYIASQTLLEPYPKPLIVTVEADRDKDYWKSEP